MANRNINGDVNVEFNEASSRQGLDSGESVKTLFGKIRKWLSDLKAVAFSGSYDDLTNKPSIPPAVAVKGNAETEYRTGNVNLTAANIGAVNKNGDTMSGTLTDTAQLIAKSTNIDRDGDNPAAQVNGNEFRLTDKNNLAVGGMYPLQETNGAIRTVIYSRSGSRYNILNVITDKDGTYRYSVSSPSAFRSAIGLDNLGYYGIGGRTTNTSTNPWVLVAETTASNSNNAGITLLFDYTYTPPNNATSTGTGILSVTVRTDANGAIITDRSYAKWLTRTNELNNDDVVITYNNSTKSLQIWAKSDYAYKIFRVRPLSGSNVYSSFDISKWTFTTAVNTNMYANYPTGDGITVLTPTYDTQEQINYNTNNGVKNILSFSGIYTTDNTYFDSIAFDKFSGAIQAAVKNGKAYSAINFPLTSVTLIDGKQYTMSAVVNSKTLPTGRMTLRRADTNLIIYGKSLNIGYNELDFTFNASDFPNGYYVSILLTEDTSQSGSIDISEYMIRESIIDDDTFEPYAKSNAELTQDLDDISGELDCLTIQAALVNDEVVIQNTNYFTNELYGKYYSETEPKFAILELHITSNTYYYKALINSSSVRQATVMEASFITVNGTYMSIYNFNWSLSGTVGTPTVSHTSLNLGS